MKYINWGNMRTGLEALYFLDNALTDPSEEYLRIINKEENETYLKYIVDNGSGDTLYVIFTEDIVLIKGFSHESSLSQFAKKEFDRSVIQKIYEGVDEKYISLFDDREIDETTFFIWYDGKFHQNKLADDDGSKWMMGYICETYDDFKEFVTDYYEMDFDENLLEKLYTDGKLDENELSQLIGGES